METQAANHVITQNDDDWCWYWLHDILDKGCVGRDDGNYLYKNTVIGERQHAN